MHFAKRMSRLGTETAFEVLAKAKALEAQGRNIVHLEIGEPDFDTPENIREAGKKALDQGFTHYGPSAGLPELREALAKSPRPGRSTSSQECRRHSRREAGDVLHHPRRWSRGTKSSIRTRGSRSTSR